MKLGKQTGSLVNYVYTTSVGPLPVVGMGATICLWTDRNAATVVAVTPAKGQSADDLHDGMTIEVCEDRAIVVSGSTHDGSAEYRYEPRTGGRELTYRMKDGQWRQMYTNAAGRLVFCKKGDGCGLALGRRAAYRDPSF